MPATPAWTMLWSVVVLDCCFLMLVSMIYVLHYDGPRWLTRMLRVMIAYIVVETVLHGPMEWIAASVLIWWRR